MLYVTQTVTTTYTIIDIRRVFEGFQADVRALVGRTGLWSEEYAEDIVSDVLSLAEPGYLEKVTLILFDKNGSRLRMRDYTPDNSSGDFRCDRTGNNCWPSGQGYSLKVVLRYSDTWENIPATKKDGIRRQLKIIWTPTDVDTSTYGMIQSGTRIYARNGYALIRKDYESIV